MSRSESDDWIYEAIDLGIQRLAEESTLPVVFFCTASGERHIVELQFEGETIEDDLQEGRTVLAEIKDGTYYALVWEGIAIEDDGRQLDAIYVEAGKRNENAVLTAKAYAKSETEIVTVGDLLFVENIPNLWSGVTSTRNDKKGKKAKKQSVDKIDSLDSLALYGSSYHLEQVNEGIEALCVFMVDNAGEMHNVMIQANEGEMSSDLLDDAPDFVRRLGAGKMYAVTTTQTVELEGQASDVVVILTGDNEGDAFTYVRKYQLSDSGQVARAAKPFVYAKTNNFWHENT